jgi:hypothetical protein
MISDESASRCTNHTTTKESAAYLIGKMDGEKSAIPVEKHQMLLREMYEQGKFDGALEAEEAYNTADVAPRAEWISVEERLPDDNERVLCFDPTLAESNLGAVSV